MNNTTIKRLLFLIFWAIFLILAIKGFERGIAVGLGRGFGMVQLTESPKIFYATIIIQFSLGLLGIFCSLGFFKDKW